MMRMVADASDDLVQAEQRRFASFKLADRLHQSSDDLTRMVRSYVVTADPVYKKRFELILNIRNGSVPRPLGYDNAAWGWSGVNENEPSGQAASVDSLMRQLNFSEREFEVLASARLESDRLAAMEMEAMRAVDEWRADSEAKRFGKPANQWARERVYGDEYRSAKKKILTSVDQFLKMLDERTRNEVETAVHEQRRCVYMAWGIGILAVITCVFTYFYLTHRVVNPVRDLVRHAKGLAKGDYGSHTELVACDEVATLATTFNGMSDAIQADMLQREKDQKKIAAAKTVIEAAYGKVKGDLQAAAKVQRSLLPDVMPETPGLDFAYAYIPCDELAGDTLNVLELDEHHVALYLVDVSGHGVQAALLAATLSHVLSPVQHSSSVLWSRDSSGRGNVIAPPRKVAERLNTRFPFDPELSQYFTFHYGVLDIRTLTYRFVSCGHPLPVFIGKGESPRFVNASGPGIGILPDPKFEETVVTLHPGDRMFFFSDGVLEAANSEDVDFKDGALLSNKSKFTSGNLDKVIHSLLDEAVAWADGKRLDDISAVGVEVKEAD